MHKISNNTIDLNPYQIIHNLFSIIKLFYRHKQKNLIIQNACK